ncbi:uncharacterized protein LOC143038506 isoform X2 [Oratosquilla oratoria]
MALGLHSLLFLLNKKLEECGHDVYTSACSCGWDTTQLTESQHHEVHTYTPGTVIRWIQGECHVMLQTNEEAAESSYVEDYPGGSVEEPGEGEEYGCEDRQDSLMDEDDQHQNKERIYDHEEGEENGEEDEDDGVDEDDESENSLVIESRAASPDSPSSEHPIAYSEEAESSPGENPEGSLEVSIKEERTEELVHQNCSNEAGSDSDDPVRGNDVGSDSSASFVTHVIEDPEYKPHLQEGQENDIQDFKDRVYSGEVQESPEKSVENENGVDSRDISSVLSSLSELQNSAERGLCKNNYDNEVPTCEKLTPTEGNIFPITPSCSFTLDSQTKDEAADISSSHQNQRTECDLEETFEEKIDSQKGGGYSNLGNSVPQQDFETSENMVIHEESQLSSVLKAGPVRPSPNQDEEQRKQSVSDVDYNSDDGDDNDDSSSVTSSSSSSSSSSLSSSSSSSSDDDDRISFKQRVERAAQAARAAVEAAATQQHFQKETAQPNPSLNEENLLPLSEPRCEPENGPREPADHFYPQMTSMRENVRADPPSFNGPEAESLNLFIGTVNPEDLQAAQGLADLQRGEVGAYLLHEQSTQEQEKPLEQKSPQNSLEVRRLAGGKGFECVVCSKVFNRMIKLRQHHRTHTGEKPWQCSECGKGFATQAYLRKHKQSRHTAPEQQQFSCSVCGRSFGVRSALQTHLATHATNKPFVCNVCGQSFALKFTRDTHKAQHTGMRPWVCTVCGRSYVTKYKLRAHMKAHTGELICSVCGRQFTAQDSLRRHERLHQECSKKEGNKTKTLPSCQICNKKFATPSLLKRHIGTHKRPNDYRCSECGAIFNSPGQLATHLEQHQNSGPLRECHTCSVCSRTFTKKGQLTRHLSTHTSAKAHQQIQHLPPNQSNTYVVPTHTNTSSQQMLPPSEAYTCQQQTNQYLKAASKDSLTSCLPTNKDSRQFTIHQQQQQQPAQQSQHSCRTSSYEITVTQQLPGNFILGSTDSNRGGGSSETSNLNQTKSLNQGATMGQNTSMFSTEVHFTTPTVLQTSELQVFQQQQQQ